MTTTAAPAAAFPAAVVAAAVARGLANTNDRPHPAADAARTPQKYAALAQGFRNSAWQHLNDGDLPQASNKAWGLVAETVKDISARHGGIIHTHRAITEVVAELALLETNAGDAATANWITATFLTAGKLHTNFYEDEYPEIMVIGGLIQCEELSALLYHRFGAVV